MVEPTPSSPIAPDEFTVQHVAGAAADLVAFGRRYWSLLGVDEYQEAVWECPLSTFSLDSGVSHRRAYVLAAAGVRAVLPQHACRRCGKPLSLQTREHLEQHLAGRTPEDCIDCDTLFMTAVGREVTPAAERRRAEDRARAQRRLDVEVARERWSREQVAHVAAHHEGGEPTHQIDDEAPLAVQLAALTMICSDPDAESIAAVSTWPTPLTPSTPMTESLLVACRDHDLLRIHPQSPVEVCRWEQTFDDALVAAGDHLADVGQPRCAGTSVAAARWYRPNAQAGTDPERQTTLTWMESLAPEKLSLNQCNELSDLCSALIVEETLRQFETGLRNLSLAPVPDQHRLRLRQVLMHMAEWLTIAQCCTLVVKAVRGAAKVKESNPRIPAAAASTHAVNRLVGDWERIWENGDPSIELGPTAPSGAFCADLSGITRVVFALYGLNPWSASLGVVWSTQDYQAWPQTPVGPAAQILDPDGGTDALAARQALQDLDDVEWPDDCALATAVNQVNCFVNRMHELTGDLRTALAAAFVAAEKMTTPIAVPDEPGKFRFAGWYIINVMLQAARGAAAAPADARFPSQHQPSTTVTAETETRSP